MTKQGISDEEHAALIACAYKFPERELGLIDNTEMGVLADEVTAMKKKPYVLELFTGAQSGRKGPFTRSRLYWHLKRRRGGKIVADGAEDYPSMGNALRAVKAQPYDWSKVDVVKFI